MDILQAPLFLLWWVSFPEKVETRYWSIPSFALNMKSKLKNGLCSVVPLHLQGESATRFCMFPKVKSACCSPGNTAVYLNVYDLTPVNGYFYWAGIGVFHTGVEGEFTLNFLYVCFWNQNLILVLLLGHLSVLVWSIYSMLISRWPKNCARAIPGKLRILNGY